MPLQDATIRNADIRDKPHKLSDGRGLYLLVHPNGSKYWRYRYRYAGKQKLLALGVYDDVSLSEARRKLEDARSLLRNGIDPSAERKAQKREAKQKSENSFETIAREFIAKKKASWSARYSADQLHRLEVNIFPDLGKRPIAEIEPPELLECLRKVEARGANDMAGRMRQICGQVFKFGVAKGVCKRDIAADLSIAMASHKKRHMAAVKPKELPELLLKIDNYNGEFQTRLALQFIALTFVRTTELIGGTWDEFDFDAAMWVVSDARMKMRTEHLVPLSPQALGILHRLRELNGDCRYVFTGINPAKHMSNNTILYALYRLGFHSRMTGHGFRSVASTVLNESGHFSPDAIERQLAHCERNKVRGAYNRAEYLPERRRLMSWYSSFLTELREGRFVAPDQFRPTIGLQEDSSL
jgi:integrase